AVVDVVAGGSAGDGRNVVVARRVGVDAELRAEGGAGVGVALAEDVVARAVLQRAHPDDNEIAGGLGGDGWPDLIACRVRVDTELRAEGITLRPGRAGEGHERNEEKEGPPHRRSY